METRGYYPPKAPAEGDIWIATNCTNNEDWPHKFDGRTWKRIPMVPASAPKPATPEPPECKLDWPGKDQGFAMGTADKPPEWKGPQPACSPLDRALEDFTARRKAKRAPQPYQYDEGEIEKRIAQLDMAYDLGVSLARAMSTPLPHDPPMSARLMPWRGK